MSKISPFFYFLVICFGASSWLSVNGAWLQLPILVQNLPEGWNLPSFMAVAVQIASIGPLLFGILQKFKKNLNIPKIIVGILIFGFVFQIFLAFFWDKTKFFAGSERSVALLLIFFCLSLVNCTSNVTFLPFMMKFKPNYITAYFIGMGFSALLPSATALIQGVGKIQCVSGFQEMNGSRGSNDSLIPVSIPPRFGVTAFNLVLSFFMAGSLVAFCLLNWLPSAKTALADNELQSNENDSIPSGIGEKSGVAFCAPNDSDSNNGIIESNGGMIEIKSNSSSSGSSSENISEPETPKISQFSYIFFLILTAFVCALMNGILPSIQSFSALPYGSEIFHFSVIFSNLINPVACFIPFFFTLNSAPIIGALALLATFFAGYIMAMAALSPAPLLVGKTGGAVLIILAWTAELGICAYLRTVMAEILRNSGRKSALFWCGAFTQAGAFIGAIVMFPLVNVYNLFQSAPMC